jgi:hypothetical protein
MLYQSVLTAIHQAVILIQNLNAIPVTRRITLQLQIRIIPQQIFQLPAKFAILSPRAGNPQNIPSTTPSFFPFIQADTMDNGPPARIAIQIRLIIPHSAASIAIYTTRLKPIAGTQE